MQVIIRDGSWMDDKGIGHVNANNLINLMLFKSTCILAYGMEQNDHDHERSLGCARGNSNALQVEGAKVADKDVALVQEGEGPGSRTDVEPNCRKVADPRGGW